MVNLPRNQVVNFSEIPTQATQNNIIPPGPEAYALGKFGEVPVSLYTGVPNITVPIYTIQDKDLNVNVQLTYHSAGIKVDEIPSWVGAGWVLDAGGVITRIVNQKAETPLANGQIQIPRPYIDIYRSPLSVDTYIENNNLQATANGGYDGQPDEYAFNFLGNAGKFHLDSTGAAVLYNHDGLKVKYEYVSSSQSRFIILGTNGVRYTFSDTESQSNVDGNQTAITSWHLTKIESPAGGVITFEYQSFPSVYIEGRPTEHVVEITTNPTIYSAVQTPSSVSFVNERRVSKIITSNGYIQFVPGTARRQDIRQESYPLREIQVHLTGGALLKTFTLVTSYFQANNGSKYSGPDPNVYAYLNYRLRLDAMHVADAAGLQIHSPYIFAYLGDDDPNTPDKYTLPHRFSGNQDHWGYYNAKGNSHIFPGNPGNSPIVMDKTYEMFGSPSDASGTALYVGFANGADRSVDTAAVKAGMLKYIHYPTTGKTAFEFESNSFGYGTLAEFGCGVRVKEIANYASGFPTVRKKYTYQGGAITNHPKNFYYKYYPVEYVNSTNSWGYSYLQPDLLQAFGLPVIAAQATVKKYAKIVAFPQNRLGSSSQIGYSTVTVTEPGNGRTEHSFDTSDSFSDYTSNDDTFDNIDFLKVPYMFQAQYAQSTGAQSPLSPTILAGVGATDYPYPPVYNNDWKRGVETAIAYYNESDKMIKKINREYERQLIRTIKGWKVASFSNGTQFLAVRYFVPEGWNYVKKETVTDYDMEGENPISTVTELFRDNLAHAQITRKRTSQSDGTILEGVYKYAHNYENVSNKAAFVQKMIDANVVDVPIEQTTWLEKTPSDKKVIDAVATTFKTYPGLSIELIKPYKRFQFAGKNGAIGTGFLQYPGTSEETATASYRETLRYTAYDMQGNPLSFLVNGYEKSSYLWAYRGQHPVAEILNADNAQVQTALGGTTFAQMAAMTNSADIKAKLDGLRSNLSGAMVTGFLYQPMVGRTDLFDPAGKKTSYDYDNFGRLVSIKNNSGQVTTSFCYNYYGGGYGNCDPIEASGTVGQLNLSLLNEAALPVTLVDFSTSKEGRTAHLSWKTTEEINSQHFDVERSVDGKAWTRIGSIEAKGDSKQLQYYSFKDNSPMTGENFYRLKMVDVDQTFAYSRIRNVYFENGASLYPNPLPKGEVLNIESTIGEIFTEIKIYDASGKVVFRASNPGRKVDIGFLSSGTYLVQLTATNGLVGVHRIVKQ